MMASSTPKLKPGLALMLAGAERYQVSQNPVKKKALTLEKLIERAEVRCGSALGILKNDATLHTVNPYHGREYRMALGDLRELLRKKYRKDCVPIPDVIVTVYDLPKVETPVIPDCLLALVTDEFRDPHAPACKVLQNGMLCIEWQDLAHALHPYNHNNAGWWEEAKKADKAVLAWLNERPYEVYVYNYGKPWDDDWSDPTEFDFCASAQAQGVKYWIRFYTS